MRCVYYSTSTTTNYYCVYLYLYFESLERERNPLSHNSLNEPWISLDASSISCTALLVSSTLFSMFSNKLSASSLPFAKASTSARDARRSLFMTSVKSGVAGTPRASGLWPNVGRAGFRCIVVACSLFAAVVVFPSGRPRVLLLLLLLVVVVVLLFSNNCPFASLLFRKASSSGRRAFSSSPSSFLRVFPPRDDALSFLVVYVVARRGFRRRRRSRRWFPTQMPSGSSPLFSSI